MLVGGVIIFYVLAMVIAATILFELFGPLFTRLHLQGAGEIPVRPDRRPPNAPDGTGGGSSP